MQVIINAIHTTIDDAVGTAVGNRVYELQAPQSCSFPFVLFNIVGSAPIMTFDADHYDLDFDVFIFGKRKNGIATLRTVEGNIYDALNRAELTVDNFDNVYVRNTEKAVTSLTDDIIELRSGYRVMAFKTINAS